MYTLYAENSEVVLTRLLLFLKEKKCQTVCVEVPKAQHKYVIGPRGANIAEILTNHNVSVEIPSQDSTCSTITLRGPQEKLGGGNVAYSTKSSSEV